MLRKITLWAAITSWFFLLFVGISEQILKETFFYIPEIWYHYLRNILSVILLTSYFFYTQLKIWRILPNINRLIKKVFLLGLGCGFISLFFTLPPIFWPHYFERTPWLLTLFFHIEFGLLLPFLLSAFCGWKQMILYEKNNFTVKSWRLFELSLIIFFIPNLFYVIQTESYYFRIPFLLLLVWSVVLSTNVRWIPILNFTQKLLAIARLLVILVCLAYFFISITSYFRHEPLVSDELSKSITFVSVFSFVCIYALVAVLVILFNLPTASIFEKTFKDLSLFQQLNDEIMRSQDENHIFGLLLDNAANSVKADAAWIESVPISLLISKNLSEEHLGNIRTFINSEGYNYRWLQRFHRKFLEKRWAFPYNSLLVAPLLNHKQELLGTLFLLKKMNNGFDQVTIASVNHFTLQASTAIQNLRLLSALVKNQRFQSEIRIAYQMQQSLFPFIPSSKHYQDFEIFAHSESATEVGGDYYDLYKIDDKKYSIMIADVSGNGISAAFYMAQMKGIFQSLAPLNLSPDKFMMYANAALGSCLEKSFFVTATYCYIDTEEGCVKLARAGHCPALYFNSRSKKVNRLESAGLGLGILRNAQFEQHIEVQKIDYQSQDLMLLYTDGIVEAKNQTSGKLFGYQRLHRFLEKYGENPPEEIYQELINTLHNFLGNEEISDDFTAIFIKF